VVETLLAMLNPGLKLAVEAVSLPLLEAGRSVRLHLNGELLGFLGALSAAGKQRFRLRSPATIVELDLAVLERAAVLVPQYAPASRHPAMTRDINLIVAESLRWAELEGAIAEAAGTSLESLRYRETYRDAQKDGPQKKRLLCSLLLRAADRTLTGEEADALRDRVVAACRTRFQAELVAG
jgi:phenylalanyl-tRNA synthetase beta chain